MLYNKERVIIMNSFRILKFLIPIIVIVQIVVFPVRVEAGFFDDFITGADTFLDRKAEAKGETLKEEDIKTVSDDIYTILITIAAVIAVIVGGVLGIQFLLASAEEKAKIKEALIPYIVGCMVAFGAFGIWKMVTSIFS